MNQDNLMNKSIDVEVPQSLTTSVMNLNLNESNGCVNENTLKQLEQEFQEMTKNEPPKRLRGDESYFYPANRNKITDIRWSQDSPTILEIHHNDNIYHFFEANTYLPTIRDWFNRTTPHLLLIDGSVMSGKSLISRYLLPFFLSEINKNQDFCFIYLNFSFLAGRKNLNDKWKLIFHHFSSEFRPIFQDKHFHSENYFLKLLFAMKFLKNFPNIRWIISIDEFHYIFSRLENNDVKLMANQIKTLFFNENSSCSFVLAGNAQASFWWSVGNFMENSIVLTMNNVSTEQDMENCRKVINCGEIIDILEMKSAYNLYHVARRMWHYKTPEEAYKSYVDTAMEVFWRDYAVVPNGVFEAYMEWANGSEVKPTKEMEHLLEKRGQLYYIKDANFERFLKTFYDAETKQLVRYKCLIRK